MSRAGLAALDARDPLAALREQFVLPAGVIYLDGNSLGAMPRAAAERVRRTLDREWSQDLIRSWNSAGWVDLPQTVGNKIGRLIGARDGETVAADSTSVNLFKLLAAACRLRPQRRVIVCDCDDFPTDLYIAEGLAALLGDHIELRRVRADELDAAIDDDVAVVSLSHVNYRSGAMHDMARITALAHRRGALMLWDLAHSAGAVPLQLADCDVDLAIGCGYKYLNGGPGAPAFLYVAQRLHDRLATPISGWFGHAQPFAFEARYQAAPGITRMLAGTPAVLSMVALDAALDVSLAAALDQVRAKSMTMCDAFIELVEREVDGHGFTLASPRDGARRGSQVSFRHEQAWPIMQALIAHGVIGDFRAPDILRFGFTPLYLRYADVGEAVRILGELMRGGQWRADAYRTRSTVT
ncbi:kynureninase [Solimonas terrae]|uniref:Kynureninase n=2 Tax=Solimonas terrae TaxID=1396819 RepID=A0A6M2BSA2_9GAMM|nr:kynureninase [Solimonas terrae]